MHMHHVLAAENYKTQFFFYLKYLIIQTMKRILCVVCLFVVISETIKSKDMLKCVHDLLYVSATNTQSQECLMIFVKSLICTVVKKFKIHFKNSQLFISN